MVINEVADKGSTGTCDGEDWVEIANAGSADVDLSGWTLTDDKGLGHEDAFTFGGSANCTAPVIKAGEYLVLCKEAECSFEFGISGSDTVTLHDAANATVDTTGMMGGLGALDMTWARMPDATGDFAYSSEPTPGTANKEATSVTPDVKPIVTECTAPTSAVRINEVSDKGTTGGSCGGEDWVELFNSGSEEVLLAGYQLVDDKVRGQRRV